MNSLISAFLAELLPVLLQLLAAVLMAAISAAALAMKRNFGIAIDQKAQDDLHRALMSGVKAAIAAGTPRGEVVEAAVRHTMKSVPDAIKRLKPAQSVLLNIAASKLEEASR